MKLFFLMIVITSAAFLSRANEATAAPDLVITGFNVTSQSGHYVNVRFNVRNQGTSSAPVIKISAEARRTSGGFYVVPERLVSGPGTGDGWYIRTSSRLAAGSSVRFYARLTIPASWVAERVSIRVLADSCSGEEFMPSYCRANESSETNNYSGTLSFMIN